MRTLKPQILKEGSSRHCTILLLNGSGLWPSFSHKFVVLGSSLCHFQLLEVPWRGCTGNGVLGHQGYCGKLAWHSACGLNGQPASPEEAYIPRLHGSEEGYWMQRSRRDWAEQVTDGWFILLQSWKGMSLLLFLPIMGWEDASSALSTLDDAGFLKLWNTIYKKRTTFQEPLISTRMHFFFSWRLT